VFQFVLVRVRYYTLPAVMTAAISVNRCAIYRDYGYFTGFCRSWQHMAWIL